MRVLFISNLYPNAKEPARGMFNAQQVEALAKLCTITKVIAPTPRALPDETRNGIPVVHPRFCNIPVVSRPFNGWLFARAVQSAIRNSQFDIVLVNWAYPDAYGVMLLSQKYGFPFATTVQGSDVNLLFRNPTRKRQVLRALRASRAVFCRSEALRTKLAAEGITATTVYNGVNRDLFRPLDRAEACRQLGLPENRRRILYVGNLQPVKGPSILAKAFAKLETLDHRLQTIDLIYVGEGPERAKVENILSDFPLCTSVSSVVNNSSSVSGLRSQVYLMGAKPHHEVPLWLNACDVLCLPSFNEGLPNVCIEAAACGLPVVASHVGGVPEVVKEGVNGYLVPPGNPTALAAALQRALTTPWDRNAIVQSVAQFDWNENARQVFLVLQSAVQDLKSRV